MENLSSQAAQWLKQGDLVLAKKTLIDVLRQNPKDETAWMALSSCVSTLALERACLQRSMGFGGGQSFANLMAAIEADAGPAVSEADLTARQVETVAPAPQPILPVPPYVMPRARTPFSISLPARLAAILAVTAAAVWMAVHLVTAAPETAEHAYARGMVPVQHDLNTWISGPVYRWENRLYTQWGATGITYRQVLADSKTLDLAREDVEEAFVPDGEAILQDGETILAAMDVLQPPEEIADSHAQVETCVRYEMERVDTLLSYIQGQGSSEMSANACQDFAEHRDNISRYIATHR
ncbi:MAG: hypothetical protein VB089_21400 [Anaerolineaceae bacterium]|jgi:hypothetical protein|nr:hypothetical protein [Anaerolineaceae bacterium]